MISLFSGIAIKCPQYSRDIAGLRIFQCCPQDCIIWHPQEPPAHTLLISRDIPKDLYLGTSQGCPGTFWGHPLLAHWYLCPGTSRGLPFGICALGPRAAFSIWSVSWDIPRAPFAYMYTGVCVLGHPKSSHWYLCPGTSRGFPPYLVSKGSYWDWLRYLVLTASWDIPMDPTGTSWYMHCPGVPCP